MNKSKITNPKKQIKANSQSVPEDTSPGRADRALTDILSGQISRSSLARMIRQGQILVDGQRIKPSTIIRPGQLVMIEPGEEAPEIAGPSVDVPEPNILIEDNDIIVIDKPAGLVVHPGAGTRTPTLMDLLVKSRPEMIGIGEPGRWGIVHRLDKDTTGVMVVAKTPIAHQELSEQFRKHSVGRVYLALVRGNPKLDSGTIEKELGRSRTDRKKISTVTRKGRSAVSHWMVTYRYGSVSLVEVRPQTGRTHQIRVHLASIGLPILGDRVYGTPTRRQKSRDPLIRRVGLVLKRQALHATFLAIIHPVSGQALEFSSGLPEDMQAAIKALISKRPES
jgi:23S rRNA pseudouridine1911/1915/1917 synthase